MSAIALGVVAGVLTAVSLPDGVSFDTISYTFRPGSPLGPRGTLYVGAEGRVSYGHETDAHTGSGGKVTRKSWTISKQEAAALFRELVAGGLLDLKDAEPWAPHTFHLSAGKWQLAVSANAVPDKIAAALRPLLAKAHPELWEQKAAPPKAVPFGPALTKFRYDFTPKVTGDAATLDVARDGAITYRREAKPAVRAEWRLPGSEAAALLDALVVSGALGLEDTGGGKFPNHGITAHAGRWRTFYHPKELPANVMRHLQPLLEKADPEFWKPAYEGSEPASVGGAVLVGALGIRPLPDARAPIDSLSYSFGTSGGAIGAGLHITKDGKVQYRHRTAPFTGSGGVITEKDWTLPPGELKELFAKLVADGLLEGSTYGNVLNEIRVTSGRWTASLDTNKVPEKAMRHLRPLLEKAHPELWAEKPPLPATRKLPQEALESKEPGPQPGVLWQFNYYFAPKAKGDHATLCLGRNGEVSYQRYTNTETGATETHVRTAWTIPAKEAEAILDALAAGGVCDLEIVGRDTFPVHRVEVGTGRWWSTFHTKPLPEKFIAPVRTLLKKADGDFWK